MSSSAWISAGASLLGAGINAISQNQANKANREMMREQNAFNREERELTQQWNLDQWNRENAYNSPVEQRKRLEEAGINPYNMNIDTGNASSLNSTPAHSSNTIEQKPFDVQSAFNQISEQLYKQDLMQSQSELNYSNSGLAQNRGRYFYELAGLTNWEKAFKSKNERHLYDRLVLGNYALEASTNKDNKQANLFKAQEALTLGKDEYQKYVNKYFDVNESLRIASHFAELDNWYRKGLLDYKQLELMQAQYVETQLRAKGFDIGNQISQKQLDKLIATYDNSVAAINAEEQQKYNIFNNFNKSVEKYKDAYRHLGEVQLKGEYHKARFDEYTAGQMHRVRSGLWDKDFFNTMVMDPFTKTAGAVRDIGIGLSPYANPKAEAFPEAGYIIGGSMPYVDPPIPYN